MDSGLQTGSTPLEKVSPHAGGLFLVVYLSGFNVGAAGSGSRARRRRHCSHGRHFKRRTPVEVGVVGATETPSYFSFVRGMSGYRFSASVSVASGLMGDFPLPRESGVQQRRVGPSDECRVAVCCGGRRVERKLQRRRPVSVA